MSSKAVVVNTTTPTASTTSGISSKNNAASLTATILSAYDLKHRDPPSHVSLTILKDATTTLATSKTGPPSQRHKDRNSFKFSAPKDKKTGIKPNQVIFDSSSSNFTLQDLYESTLLVKVVYTNANAPDTLLTAEYKLNQLKIGETTWLILTLQEHHANGSNGNSNMSVLASATNTAPTDDNDTAFTDVPPTLRLHLTISAPYRSEIQLLVNSVNQWCQAVDRVQHQLTNTVTKYTPDAVANNKNYLLIPIVPVAAGTAAIAPLVAGIALVGLPILWPLVVSGGLGLGLLLIVGLVLYFSTTNGRSVLHGTITAPIHHTIASTDVGQRFLYPIGPRPTPVSMAKQVLPGPDAVWGRLLVSLTIDAIGSATYLVPVIGEVFDIFWAPVQTTLIMAMYDDYAPNLKYLSFLEEIIMFTDIVPSATLGWMTQYGMALVKGEQTAEIRGGINNMKDHSLAMMSALKYTVAPPSSRTPEKTPNV